MKRPAWIQYRPQVWRPITFTWPGATTYTCGRWITCGRREGNSNGPFALDPDYAQAYSGLSDSLMLIFINHRALSPDEAFPLAQAAMDKALALESQDAEIYASLGLLKLEQWQLLRRSLSCKLQGDPSHNLDNKILTTFAESALLDRELIETG